MAAMNRRTKLQVATTVVVAALLAGGCSRAPETAPDPALHAVVYKTESCGCCGAWVTHLEDAGFAVEVHNVDNLGPTKRARRRAGGDGLMPYRGSRRIFR